MNGSEPGRPIVPLPLRLRNGPRTTLGGVRSPAASDRTGPAGETETCDGGGSRDGMGAGIAIGICLGVAVGLATDDLGLWLPVGVAIGAGLGAALRRRG